MRFTGKLLGFGNQFRGSSVRPDRKSIVKDIASSFLIMAISLSFLVALLVSNIPNVINGTFEWILAFADAMLLSFLLAIATFLLTQSLINYHQTHALDRFGVASNGLLVDKWIDVSEEKPIYYVRYQYSPQPSTPIQGVQVVDRGIFQRLRRNENVRILHLEQLPQISRLDFGG